MDKVFDNLHAKNTEDTEEDQDGKNGTIKIGRPSNANKGG
jgi:hypothetical protein